VEARFGRFGDSINLSARQGHGWRRMFHRMENHFGRDVDQVVAHFGPFGDSVNLDARWVHGLRGTAIARKSFWAQPMELLGQMG
jgi:hypothetical protein